MGEFNTQGLMNIAWALAKMDQSDERLFGALARVAKWLAGAPPHAGPRQYSMGGCEGKPARCAAVEGVDERMKRRVHERGR